MSRESERGSALVTVLLMVAAMSLLAVGISQTVSNATQREVAMNRQAQARLYLLSAEAVIKSQIADAMRQFDGRLTASVPGVSEPAIYPLPDGNAAIRISDQMNCFNVNGLIAANEAGLFAAQNEAVEDFVALAEDQGIPQSIARDLSGSLVDWLDADTVPSLGGAEDSFYLGSETSYRTAGGPMQNLSEMRLLRHMTPELFEGLEPVLCALPHRVGEAFGPLNINTLTVEQAGLLRRVFPEALSLTQAQNIVAARPVLGWPSVDAFLSEPQVAQFASDSINRDKLDVVSLNLSVLTEISYRGGVVRGEFLLAVDDIQALRTIRRERIG